MRQFGSVAISVTPQWRQARCGLCSSPILVRDDAEECVCPACGARLAVMASPSETRVRHIGEALDSARQTLDREALTRALERLKERKEAHREALKGSLRNAQVRQVMTLGGLATGALGVMLAAVLHQGGTGTLLVFIGFWLALAGLGIRLGLRGSSTYEQQQRQAERRAAEAQRALSSEIARRERALAQLDRR